MNVGDDSCLAEKDGVLGSCYPGTSYCPMPTTTGKAASTDHKVTDVTKHCPHSKFSMECTPAQGGFYKYDAATGNATVKVPMLKQDVKVSCKVHKKATNGDHETRVVDIVFKAEAKQAKSLCMINADVKSAKYPSGPTGQGSMNMASLITATPATTTGPANNKVTDVAKQCPGDVFAMTCSDMKFLSFDPKTSTGKSWVPILKEDLKVTCKIIKTAKNGEIEKRDITVEYLAAPKTKSGCAIDTSKIPQTMQAGIKGSLKVIRTIAGVLVQNPPT